MATFTELAREFIVESFELDPLEATNAGVHSQDARWPDWSAPGIERQLEFCERWLARLVALPTPTLTADEAIDRERLLLQVDDRRFEAGEMGQDAWDPLIWVYRLGDGLFPLIAREFAPPAERLASIAGRLEGIPAVVAAARERLGALDGVPVSRLHTDIALRNFSGVDDLIGEALGLADTNASEPEVAVLRTRLDTAAETARAALGELRTHLRRTVLRKAEGEGRLGRDRFAARLRRTFSDPSISPDDVLAAAETDYPAVRGEMMRIARELWPEWCPDRAMPDDEGALVRAVCDAIAGDHPAADELLDASRAELVRIEAFCRERELIGLTDEPLQIQWTPIFLRPFAGAMLHSPGPFDRGQKAFFSITPPDPTWPPERVESMLREHNQRQLRLLTIHEAVPGHYLQGVYGNRNPSLVRSVYGDGVYAEGWAVYVTQVMLDEGFDADDPALLLMNWKYYLRAVVNAIIDVRIHVHGMTRDEAISLMVDGAFQELSEATGKWDRARLSSTQLSTYFIGARVMWDLEDEARRRAAVASGDPRGEAAVPKPRILGGYGTTPGFLYRRHLESVLSGGELPLPLLRRALFGG
ncbi:MAG: DUF885 domain-containing protein [Chloroflexota bacterium]